MNDDQKFWVNVWKIVAVCFCVLTLTIGGCYANQVRIISEMVEKGADPLKSECAIYGISSSNAAVCGALTK